METTKHTPGPWKVSPRIDRGIYAVGTPSDDPDLNLGEIVCKVYARDEGENLPNARLIAAAPELLEALKGAFDYLTSKNYWEQMQNADLHNSMKAAIAKAEGREQKW